MEQDIIKKFSSLFEKKDYVDLVYLFGSEARGVANKRSDIDLAVQISEVINAKRYFFLRLEMMNELQDYSGGRTIDLVILNNANPRLRHQILKYGKIIFQRTTSTKLKFEIATRKLYFDYLYFSEKYTQEFFKQIKEVGLLERYRGNRNPLEDARRLRKRLKALSEDQLQRIQRKQANPEIC